MRRAKLVLVAFLLLSSAAGAAAASASAWTTNGPLNFTAHAPPARFTVANVVPRTVDCIGQGAGNRAVGTLNVLSGSPGTLLVGNLQLSFSDCSFGTLGPSVGVSCTTAELRGVSYSAATMTTTGEVRNLSCTLSFATYTGCTITVTGSGVSGRAFAVTYRNSTGRLLVQSGQTMTASWNGPCTFLYPSPGSGAATLSGVSSTVLPFDVVSLPWPSITDP